MVDKPKQDRMVEWQQRFLAALRNSGNVRASCQAAGVSRKHAYTTRQNDEEFQAQWNDAMEDAIEYLEAIARQRAATSSDTLLIFLLKAHRPEKYRETVRQEHTGASGNPIEIRTLNVIPPVEAFTTESPAELPESVDKG